MKRPLEESESSGLLWLLTSWVTAGQGEIVFSPAGVVKKASSVEPPLQAFPALFYMRFPLFIFTVCVYACMWVCVCVCWFDWMDSTHTVLGT